MKSEVMRKKQHILEYTNLFHTVFYAGSHIQINTSTSVFSPATLQILLLHFNSKEFGKTKVI